MEALYGLLLPFLGTSLGAASVFFMKKAMSDGLQKGLTGFAAGVMTAASVWSLLIPAIERSEELGKWSFAPAAACHLLQCTRNPAAYHALPPTSCIFSSTMTFFPRSAVLAAATMPAAPAPMTHKSQVLWITSWAGVFGSGFSGLEMHPL